MKLASNAASNTKGIREKKLAAVTPLMASASTGKDKADKPQQTNGSTSPAMWNRYIDSRMKQFGTR